MLRKLQLRWQWTKSISRFWQEMTWKDEGRKHLEILSPTYAVAPRGLRLAACGLGKPRGVVKSHFCLQKNSMGKGFRFPDDDFWPREESKWGCLKKWRSPCYGHFHGGTSCISWDSSEISKKRRLAHRVGCCDWFYQNGNCCDTYWNTVD